MSYSYQHNCKNMIEMRNVFKVSDELFFRIKFCRFGSHSHGGVYVHALGSVGSLSHLQFGRARKNIYRNCSHDKLIAPSATSQWGNVLDTICWHTFVAGCVKSIRIPMSLSQSLCKSHRSKQIAIRAHTDLFFWEAEQKLFSKIGFRFVRILTLWFLRLLQQNFLLRILGGCMINIPEKLSLNICKR